MSPSTRIATDLLALMVTVVVAIFVFSAVLVLNLIAVLAACAAGLSLLVAVILTIGWALGVSPIAGPAMYWVYSVAAIGALVIIALSKSRVSVLPAQVADWFFHRGRRRALEAISRIRLANHRD